MKPAKRDPPPTARPVARLLEEFVSGFEGLGGLGGVDG